MIITREELIARHGASMVNFTEETIQHTTLPDAWMVYEWDKAPRFIKLTCNYNGGDEDWVAWKRGPEPEYGAPSWVEHLSVDYDTYLLDGVTIYVGSHA